MSKEDSNKVILDNNGLINAICQDATSGEVLMIAHMNPEALERTLSSKQVHFYSRSRNELWHKGATSGSILHLDSAYIDCDGDALLFKVHPAGPACHTGANSCFFTEMVQGIEVAKQNTGSGVLAEIFQTIKQRQKDLPPESYTSKLFESGSKRIAQKVAEEGAEVAIAGATADKDSIVGEVADLFFHTLVLLADAEITPEQVWMELRARQS